MNEILLTGLSLLRQTPLQHDNLNFPVLGSANFFFSLSCLIIFSLIVKFVKKKNLMTSEVFSSITVECLPQLNLHPKKSWLGKFPSEFCFIGKSVCQHLFIFVALELFNILRLKFNFALVKPYMKPIFSLSKSLWTYSCLSAHRKQLLDL